MISMYYLFSLFFFIWSMFSFFFGMIFMFLDYSVMVEWEIFSLNSSVVLMAIILDWMSLIFMSFVFFISSMVFFYSKDYMSVEVNSVRFILLVFLFVCSMAFLIISPNLISILLGWDGLGLVSYCLVIYYQNMKSANAGMLTALTNRIGDVFILLSISWMLNFGSWNYIYYYDYFFNSFDYSLICYMIMIAAMTKSAQIPFSAWLPAAMAAPTPVSALVHSSTLVTAGVYLLIRFSPLLSFSGVNYYLLFFGCLTMFMSGIAANYEFDLKKVIALSTLSQLGLMMSVLAMGFPLLSFFHLLTHALFKSLLFLCAGFYIHNLFDNQDIRYMGSLSLFFPYTSICFNISSLSLCGFPFLAGFYSKDLILELSSFLTMNSFIYLIFFLSTGLTAMYSIRLFYYSLVKSYSSGVLWSFNHSSRDMCIGMFFLLLFTVIGGSMLFWLIFPYPVVCYLPLVLKFLVIFVVVTGFYLGHLINNLNFSLIFSSGYLNLKEFFGSMWFLPLLSTKMFSFGALTLSGQYLLLMDYGWLEYYGAQGLYTFFLKFISEYLNLFDYNFKTYLLLFFVMLLLLFFYIILI
uniref:NADH-ubiquinone oxidoreductase chain 5 n=2 Tax=Trachytettix bufo TaxID=1260748 RepID=M4JDH3_9ORTH|nr:NADH dehydrogenase subunit 5 [Trachytettix bufo]